MGCVLFFVIIRKRTKVSKKKKKTAKKRKNGTQLHKRGPIKLLTMRAGEEELQRRAGENELPQTQQLFLMPS